MHVLNAISCNNTISEVNNTKLTNWITCSYNGDLFTEDTYSRFRLHLQGSFSSQEEKETFLRRFEAAKQLLAPGCKRNATISVLNTLLDRVLTQPENVQASNSRTSYSRNEMMLDSAG